MLNQNHFQTCKVSGTTFQPVSDDQLHINSTHKTQFYNGWIQAEPTNRFDKFAQKVHVFVPNGVNQNDDHYIIGYVPKNSGLYQHLKNNNPNGMSCRIRIEYLKDKGLNNRYTLMYH